MTWYKRMPPSIPGIAADRLSTPKEKLSGINTVKITSAEGIGFAIPINTVKPIIDSFVNKGTFDEAYLGVFAYDKEAIPYLDSSINFSTGVYVVQVASRRSCRQCRD